MTTGAHACAAGAGCGPPLVSVIMANHNGARHLEAAIESVRAQSLARWELILIDDCSGDASVQIAEAAARRDPRIRLARQRRNTGPGAARNVGLDLARGRWIAIVDSDDLLSPDRLERLRARSLADRAAIVADDMLLFSDAHPRRRSFLPRRLRAAPAWISLAQFIDSNRMHARLPDLGFLKPFIEARAIREANVRYDPALRIGEDYDFLSRLMAAGHPLRIEPAAGYHYRKHAQSTSHRRRASDVEAQIAADRRWLAQVRPLDAREAAAFARRQRSFQSVLEFETVVDRLKAGDTAKGLALALAAPRIWPMLAGPITARLARLRASFLHRRQTHGQTT